MRRLRVLLVDDDALLRRALARILHAHDVVSCGGGAEAITILRSDPGFDVILCDLQMPGMDGIDTFQAASRMPGRLADRFVFLTGGACDERTDGFLGAHAGQVLWKPIAPAAVCAAIAARVDELQDPIRAPAT